MLGLAGCGGGGGAVHAIARPPPPQPLAGVPCAVAPRGGELRLRVLAGTPAVIVHVPDRLRAGERAPLVLGLHGAGQDARGFEAESNLSGVADEHRFVVAYPMSWRPRGFWRYPEPDNPRSGLRLLRATIDAVAQKLCVDRGRVLVTGISSGGRMTYAAGCELADRLLAIAPVSGGTRELPPCHPARPISILDTHGTSDQIVSYRGRGPTHDGRVRDVMAGWARREGCHATPRSRRIDPHVVRLEWPGCRAGVRVAHLRIEGGRHAWPPLGGPPGIGIDGA
ncbi:MAG TPA: PHB depolymerase family esterase, partial [Solirubrobacteraceae bacterium]